MTNRELKGTLAALVERFDFETVLACLSLLASEHAAKLAREWGDEKISAPYAAVSDALEALSRVPEGALSFVYLLHPDPWPKTRHIKRRMMNDGPIDLIAAKLKPGGEFRFGTDHPVYVAHAMMIMRRHRDQFDWLADDASAMLQRPGGWPETRYEAKARRLGHEVWYFRYRRR